MRNSKILPFDLFNTDFQKYETVDVTKYGNGKKEVWTVTPYRVRKGTPNRMNSAIKVGDGSYNKLTGVNKKK